MTARILFVALLLAVPGAGRTANVGVGYGESLLVLTSARQAGTGGLALEDPWRQGTMMEANSVLYTSGLKWVGVGGQGGLGSWLRLGGEAFVFQGPSEARTVEFSDGSYGGQSGNTSAQEWGGRLEAQWTGLSAGAWRVAALGRASGIWQKLPDAAHLGGALEAGAQAQRVIGTGQALTAWALAGPLGGGAGYLTAWRVEVGAGWLEKLADGFFLPGPEGYGFGAEGAFLSEGLGQGGAGALYWFGDPSDEGVTLFIRAGVRYQEMSAQVTQPRGGIGILWRGAGMPGFQFDYALAPLGALGLMHYGTLAMRLTP